MTKKQIFILVCIFVIALSVRGVMLYYLHNNDYFGGIKLNLDTLARNLAQGYGFSAVKGQRIIPFYQQLPGYPFLLAITYKIFGRANDIFLQIIQVILSSLSVFLIFEIAKGFFNRKIALLSSFLWAIWLPEVRISIAALYGAPTIFLTLLASYFFIRATLDRKQLFFIYSAVILGLASYIRSEPMLLPVFFGLALWVYWKNWKKAFWKTLVMLSIVFIVLTPWGMRNYHLFHRFTFARATLWQSMWEGFGEFRNPFGAVLSDRVTYEQISKEHPGISYASPEYQDACKVKVIKALKSKPQWYILMLPKRLAFMLFRPRGIGFLLDITGKQFNHQHFLEQYPGLGNIDYTKWLFKNAPSRVLLELILITLLQFFVVFSIFIGFWLTKQQWRKNMLLLSPFLYFYLAHLPIYWEPRYLIPGEFPMLIFTAVVIVHIWYSVKNKFRTFKLSIR